MVRVQCWILSSHFDHCQLTLGAAHNPVRTVSDPPLEIQEITDRGFFADPDHARLRAWVKERGGIIKDLGICVGTMIQGEKIKMEELGDAEKDDL